MTHTRTSTLELPYPPPSLPELTTIMRSALEARVPTGEKLHRLISKTGTPDLGEDFQPCYRMQIRYETTDIEPLLWEGQD